MKKASDSHLHVDARSTPRNADHHVTGQLPRSQNRIVQFFELLRDRIVFANGVPSMKSVDSPTAAIRMSSASKVIPFASL